MANRWGNNGNSERLYLLGAPKSLQTKQQQQSLSGLIQKWEPSGLSGVRWGSKAVGTQMLEAGDGEEPSRLIIGPWKSCHTRHRVSEMAFAQMQLYLSRRFHIYHFILCLCYLFILRIIENYSSPWRKNCDKPRKSTKTQRHHLLTKVHIAKAMVFLVAVYECESWTIKKAENERTDAFKLWCWRRLLRVLWTAISNQLI